MLCFVTGLGLKVLQLTDLVVANRCWVAATIMACRPNVILCPVPSCPIKEDKLGGCLNFSNEMTPVMEAYLTRDLDDS